MKNTIVAIVLCFMGAQASAAGVLNCQTSGSPSKIQPGNFTDIAIQYNVSNIGLVGVSIPVTDEIKALVAEGNFAALDGKSFVGPGARRETVLFKAYGSTLDVKVIEFGRYITRFADCTYSQK